MSSELLRDDCGWFARWSFNGSVIESLRTNNKGRAEDWKLQGSCHGARFHTETCDKCRPQVPAVSGTVAEAVKLLGEVTGGSFDVWRLTGPHNAALRAAVLSAASCGQKVAKSKAGVTVLRDTLYGLLGADKVDGCQAVRDWEFSRRCRFLVG